MIALEQVGPEFSPALAGERKLVTVMFADISGFTALVEMLDPEAVRELMNACFSRLVPVIEKYEGTVDKFIGDEIMALFGAPVAHENDPERALRAALEMMNALAAFNAEHDTELGIHVGINAGLVVAGGIGSEGRQRYSVMGDAVNLASRLEDLSKRGEILVGPDTYCLTTSLFDYVTEGANMALGHAFRLLGDWEQATVFYETARDKNQITGHVFSASVIYEWLGESYLATGRFQEAIEAAEQLGADIAANCPPDGRPDEKFCAARSRFGRPAGRP